MFPFCQLVQDPKQIDTREEVPPAKLIVITCFLPGKVRNNHNLHRCRLLNSSKKPSAHISDSWVSKPLPGTPSFRAAQENYILEAGRGIGGSVEFTRFPAGNMGHKTWAVALRVPREKREAILLGKLRVSNPLGPCFLIVPYIQIFLLYRVLPLPLCVLLVTSKMLSSVEDTSIPTGGKLHAKETAGRAHPLTRLSAVSSGSSFTTQCG